MREAAVGAQPVHRVDQGSDGDIEIWQGAEEYAPSRTLPPELFAQEEFATESSEGCLSDRIHGCTLHAFAYFTKR